MSEKAQHYELIAPTDPRLNSVSAEVEPHDIPSLHVQDVIHRMLELAAGKGKSAADSRQMVGLAAVQIGVNLRIISVDLTADGSNKPQNLQIIINPTIVKKSHATVLGREGCWSCGDICGIVKRAQTVEITGYDQSGAPIELHLTDFVARIAQHEIDHLDGIRFPDRIPLDKPERLHLVKPAEFVEYRMNWMHWSKRCDREAWEEMKSEK